jgi:hypothetical protein
VPEHVRDVWTLHGIQSTITASLYRSVFGLELRVELAGELIESRLSRVGEEPLEPEWGARRKNKVEGAESLLLRRIVDHVLAASNPADCASIEPPRHVGLGRRGAIHVAGR